MLTKSLNSFGRAFGLRQLSNAIAGTGTQRMLKIEAKVACGVQVQAVLNLQLRLDPGYCLDPANRRLDCTVVMYSTQPSPLPLPLHVRPQP